MYVIFFICVISANEVVCVNESGTCYTRSWRLPQCLKHNFCQHFILLQTFIARNFQFPIQQTTRARNQIGVVWSPPKLCSYTKKTWNVARACSFIFLCLILTPKTAYSSLVYNMFVKSFDKLVSKRLTIFRPHNVV